MWWASISMAVVFSPPLGTMMSALLDVPHQTAQDALVGVGVHEDLIVEHGA